MSDSSSTQFDDTRGQTLARLATLQRLRDQAKAGKREAMLRSLEQLIEQEAEALREREAKRRA